MESFCECAGHYEWSMRHVKWLRANGCPWDEATTEYAKTEEIYLWATQNGCPKENGCLVGGHSPRYEW